MVADQRLLLKSMQGLVDCSQLLLLYLLLWHLLMFSCGACRQAEAKGLEWFGSGRVQLQWAAVYRCQGGAGHGGGCRRACEEGEQGRRGAHCRHA